MADAAAAEAFVNFILIELLLFWINNFFFFFRGIISCFIFFDKWLLVSSTLDIFNFVGH